MTIYLPLSINLKNIENIPMHKKASSKVVAIIPARYHSNRFEGKPLADILGKPMIQHVYERAESVDLLSRVAVATDDDRIAECVSRFGGEVVMTRSDHVSGTDRLAEAAEKMEIEEISKELRDVMRFEQEQEAGTKRSLSICR